MQINPLINPKNASIAALVSAIMPIAIKQGDLTQFDWASIISLSIGAITTLIVEIREKKIISTDDIRRFIDFNQTDHKVIGVIDLESDIISHLFDLYRCSDPMFIVDARTNMLEWLNVPAAKLIGIDPEKPIPQRDMSLFWRRNDLGRLNDVLFGLDNGRSIIHEYEAAFKDPYDWCQAVTQFKNVELNNGSIKRISRSIEKPVRLQLPFDQRRYLRERGYTVE